VDGCCDHGNELLSCVKCEEFFSLSHELLSLKKVCV
jgi:hypothetical protein